MPPPSRLLVPIDFGSASDCAIDLAIAMAEKFDAELTLLHAYSLPPALYGGALFWPSDEYRRAARETLEAVVKATQARYPKVRGELVEGAAAEKILAAAEAGRADLIVMGTEGRRGVAHVLIGSVTERVLRLSRVPVLTVSAGALRRAERAEQAER